MTTEPQPDRDRALIEAILKAYHTTRLSEVSAAAHILSKPYVREALASARAEGPQQDTAGVREGATTLADMWCTEGQKVDSDEFFAAIHAVAEAIYPGGRKAKGRTMTLNLSPHDQQVLSALKRLTFAARTSGGTAGPDPGLMAACDEAEAILSALPQQQADCQTCDTAGRCTYACDIGSPTYVDPTPTRSAQDAIAGLSDEAIITAISAGIETDGGFEVFPEQVRAALVEGLG